MFSLRFYQLKPASKQGGVKKIVWRRGSASQRFIGTHAQTSAVFCLDRMKVIWNGEKVNVTLERAKTTV